jgi:hypothetical protein
MTAHPTSVNAGSADGERRANAGNHVPDLHSRLRDRADRSAIEGMRLETGAAETVFTGEIRDQSQLYGLLDRVRDLGLELVSVEPQPATDSHNRHDEAIGLRNNPH